MHAYNTRILSSSLSLIFLRLVLISIIIFFGKQNSFIQITNAERCYVLLWDHTMLLLFPFPVMTFPSHNYTTPNYSHAKMTGILRMLIIRHGGCFCFLKLCPIYFRRLHDYIWFVILCCFAVNALIFFGGKQHLIHCNQLWDCDKIQNTPVNYECWMYSRT